MRRLRDRYCRYAEGYRESSGENGYYPYVGITIRLGDVSTDMRVPYGALSDSGTYGTTLTKPALFRNYYLEQLRLLIANHGRPIAVGFSDRAIALPFVIEDATTAISSHDLQALQSLFTLPDLATIEDSWPRSSASCPGKRGRRSGILLSTIRRTARITSTVT